MKIKNSTRIIVAVAIVVVIAGWFAYDYMFSSNTVTEAIEQTAIESFEEVYKIADVEKVDDKTVCIFESRGGGMGMSVLNNNGSKDLPRYEQIAFQHVSFGLIKDDISKYYVLNEEKNRVIVCGIIKKLSNSEKIYINNNEVKLKTYKGFSYWVYSCKADEKIKISLAKSLENI